MSELIPQNAGSPDLLIIDIDSIDYSILHRLDYLKPRVIVVEIEKMFKGNFSVKLKSPEFFNQGMSNSGSTSLGAWVNLLTPRGYYLCALSGTGFNAFFVRDDVSAAKIEPLSMDDAFDKHPIFSKLPVDFWVTPNENWVEV